MKDKKEIHCRLGKVGGEAVLEGVMMKSGERCATAIRTPDGGISASTCRFVSAKTKNKILGLPILRGVVSYVETMRLSMRVLNVSAEALGIEETEGKAEAWLKKHLGVRAMDLLMGIAAALGVALAIFLFMFLPALATRGITFLTGPLPTPVFALIEGAFKVAIFISYIALVGLIPDIRRTFQYHGAEHKSIACYESGDELTPHNAKNHTRFHPRCGTSFLFVMILLGIFVGMFIPSTLPAWLRSVIKIALLPFVMGIGYEFIMYAGKHNNLLVRILSAPGLLMQNLTTREPDESQLEIAITAMKLAMPEEFPDFDTAHLRFMEESKTSAEKETDAAAAAAGSIASDPERAASEKDQASGEDPSV